MEDREDLDGLVARWTLLAGERELVEAKHAGSRLGFALLLKRFVALGRFAHGADEFSSEAVAFVARQLDVSSDELAGYEWSGRTIERHRSEIRSALHQAEVRLTQQIVSRLGVGTVTRLDSLLAESGDEEPSGVLGLIRSAPGNVSLNTLLVEIRKLRAVRDLAGPGSARTGYPT